MRRTGARSTEEVALAELDLQRTELVALASGLDPLGDQHAAALSSEVDDPRDERLADIVVIDVADEPDVELHEIGSQLEDVAEAGEARAGVINRDPDLWANACDRRSKGGVVLDRDVLRHLEHRRATGLAQAALQTTTLEEEVR